MKKNTKEAQKVAGLVALLVVLIIVIIGIFVAASKIIGHDKDHNDDIDSGIGTSYTDPSNTSDADTTEELTLPPKETDAEAHTYTKYNVQASCTGYGFTYNIRDDLEREFIDIKLPVGHHYGKWYIKNNKMCRTCTICNKTESYPINTSKQNEFMLNVKNILQGDEFPNGCEIASLSIVLNYLGYKTDIGSIVDNYLVTSSVDDPYADPWNTYIGNPRDVGYGCYAPCIVDAANAFLQDKGGKYTAFDISGSSMDTLLDYVKDGHPVILWGTLYMDGVNRECKWFVDKETKKLTYWLSHSHCVVLIGYNDDKYIVADPIAGIVKYDKNAVKYSYKLLYKQACVIK